MSDPVRLMIYDRTCRSEARLFGLSSAWGAGARLYRMLDRLDATFGATSWEEALSWVARVLPDRPIAEVQFWGHGKWGCALVDRQPFDARALREGHPLHRHLAAVRERLVPPAAPGREALVWFRTCETLGAAAGLDFAPRLADHLGARVAGHTFIIGATQSGLRGVHPGARPDWSGDEGLAEGTPAAPVRALWSGLTQPRTITCLTGAVPDGWLAR